MNKSKRILIAVIFFCSCNSGHEKVSKSKADNVAPAFSNKKYDAFIVTTDSGKRAHITLQRVVYPYIKTDSITHSSLIEADTLVGYVIAEAILDVNGKPSLDSLGRPKTKAKQILIKDIPDSVDWDVNLKDIDSMLSIRGVFTKVDSSKNKK